jgi:hypothetical protein
VEADPELRPCERREGAPHLVEAGKSRGQHEEDGRPSGRRDERREGAHANAAVRGAHRKTSVDALGLPMNRISRSARRRERA